MMKKLNKPRFTME